MDIEETISNNPIRLVNNYPLDIKNVAVDTVEELYAVPMNERYIGLTKLVKSEGKEYWLKTGMNNEAWEVKTADSSSEDAGVPLLGSDVEEF